MHFISFGQGERCTKDGKVEGEKKVSLDSDGIKSGSSTGIEATVLHMT